MTKTKYLGFRSDPELYRLLLEYAEADQRSLSSLVQKILKEWIEDRIRGRKV